ncbi:ANTAR domain-containing protein [Actinomycetospora sp. TBRC 11914]|uniref:ANTAR domain-containing protein n=1 Tax=Actinomycetospora sp. TBRC 11914 TaxID=2729387 RepID=UPI00145C8B6A|nr:ANTAR domain-containing protein [Actinomycetospora sp. TBRC 11914]NMO93579.1 ANTAR domain-containing protein [Actinomycetospora sp. TBRC 11914]
MVPESEWQAARQRFVEHATGPLPELVAPREVALDLGPLAAQFLELGEVLFHVPLETGVIGVLERVVQQAQALVPAADMVSVTLRERDGSFRTPVETDPLATRADLIQYETGEGPCIEATAAASPGFVVSRDLGRDPAYPRFGPRVVQLGMSALCATGMFPGGETPRSGALNYYFRDPEDLAGVDPDVMLLLAAHGAVALRAARAVEAEQLRSSQLSEALQSRDVIGQAKGILMERRGIGAEEAFDVLRRTSQDLNIKLRDLASTIALRRAEL